jgi:hypothetical protein
MFKAKAHLWVDEGQDFLREEEHGVAVGQVVEVAREDCAVAIVETLLSQPAAAAALLLLLSSVGGGWGEGEEFKVQGRIPRRQGTK